ncbi:MAG: polysaccharide deacetylase family protein [Thermoproteota archaeon]|nr:polysaccharide deacetylase family protein [Thermoproteota archaeon]
MVITLLIFNYRKHFQATRSSIPLAIILTITVVSSMVMISPSTTNSQFSYSRSDQSSSSPQPASPTSFIKFKTTTPTLQAVASSSKSASHHHRTHASPPSSTSTLSKSSPSSGVVLATTNGSSNPNSYLSINDNKDKVVIINFDDSFKNQFLYAKPILDKYGFKATFFEVCNFIGSNGKKTWQDVSALQKDGMDIESHTMTHPHLNTLSQASLNYEIGGSKQCLLNHGINPPIFAYPYSEGSNNPSVVGVVGKYYTLARTDSGFPLTFLQCDGWKNHQQTDCRTYSGNGGTLTFANRYSIKGWTHRHIDGPYSSSQEGAVCAGVCHSYDNSQMLQVFIADVNSQLKFNQGGIVKAIPIVIYHNFVTYPDITNSKDAADTTVNLFDEEMKYLHDNGFKVLTLNQLGYDTTHNVLDIKNISPGSSGRIVSGTTTTG